jgi:hypothetical protein
MMRRSSKLILATLSESKSGKNRMHLDIQVANLAPELTRLRDLGATVIVEPHDDAGYLTAVLADPQGNEFCVIVPPPGSRDRERLAAEGRRQLSQCRGARPLSRA